MRAITALSTLFLLGAAPVAAAPPPSFAVGLAVYRPSTQHIYALSNLGTRSLVLNGVYGSAGATPVVADFDGNGVYDLAVHQGGQWSIDRDHDLVADQSLIFGATPGDIPLAGDFDGDGIADLVIFRSGLWYVRSSIDGSITLKALGGAGDTPLVADFDGDGVPDIAVYRLGTWSIQTHSANSADIVAHFGGLPQDKPCAVDWNHDGRADLCVFRDGVWYFKSLGQDGLLDTYAFGGKGDIPLPGGSFDYAGALYVKAGVTGTQDGSMAHPFATMAKAFDAATDGGVIRVLPGTYAENFVFFGPSHNYAPGKFGKNNVKLIGVDRRAVKWTAASGDAITLIGATGNVIENFSLSAPASRAVVFIGGLGSVNPTDPGSTASVAFNSIDDTDSFSILVTGSSNADIRYNHIQRSRTRSGIGLQSGSPSATVVGNELDHHGYTLAEGADGNGFLSTGNSTVTLRGNWIHHNNRFGVIGAQNTQLTADGNTVEANELNGIILCGADPGDLSQAVITNNRILDNGVSRMNGMGYNGIEIYQTCTRSHTISGNLISGNSLNGLFFSGGTLTLTNNTFTNNFDAVNIYADNNNSGNTVATIYNNRFIDNQHIGVFVFRDAASSKTSSATIGGTGANQANVFSGQGAYGIACIGTVQATCPSGGNSFSANATDISPVCPNTCVK